MKYAVVIKTSRGEYFVHATSATIENARKRRSRSTDTLGGQNVFIVPVGEDVRKDQQLDESCLTQRVW